MLSRVIKCLSLPSCIWHYNNQYDSDPKFIHTTNSSNIAKKKKTTKAKRTCLKPYINVRRKKRRNYSGIWNGIV